MLVLQDGKYKSLELIVLSVLRAGKPSQVLQPCGDCVFKQRKWLEKGTQA